MSEIIYMALNIVLAIALLFVVRSTGSLLPALALVLLSKWRVLAVRPRYWFANIQANMVDFIVSISLVVFLLTANSANIDDGQKLLVQVIITLVHIVWLLFIKPRSKRAFIVIQSAVALFLGVSATYTVAYDWWDALVVIFVWVIGYSTARHVLTNYDESHVVFLSILWGLVMAEIGWLAYHWTIAYRLPIIQNILLPQVAIIVLCVGFVAYKAYDSYFHHQKIRTNDIILPLLFTLSVIAVLVLAFNGVSTGVV
jgi:hypothetical protein